MNKSQIRAPLSALGGMNLNSVVRYAYLSFLECESEIYRSVNVKFDLLNINVRRKLKSDLQANSGVVVTGRLNRLVLDEDNSVMYILSTHLTYDNPLLANVEPIVPVRIGMLFTEAELLEVWGTVEKAEDPTNVQKTIMSTIFTNNTLDLDNKSGLLLSAKVKIKIDNLINKIHADDMDAFNVSTTN